MFNARRLTARWLVPLLLSLATSLSAQNPLLPTGTRAPRFVLKDLFGKDYYSVNLGNKPALVVFVAISEQLMPPIVELMDLQERFKARRLACVAIGYAPQTMPGYRIIPQARVPPQFRLELPVLLDSQNLARQFGVLRDNAVFFLDDNVVRGAATFAGAPNGFIELKAAIWLAGGAPPEKIGWRGDLAETWLRVIDGRTRFGFPLTKPPAAQVARELRSFVGRPELRVWMQAEGESESVVASLRSMITEALAAWQPALPHVKFMWAEDRNAADLVLMFRPQVLDPRDARGLRTLCSYARTLAEPLPAESPAAQRVNTLVQIAAHHDPSEPGHSQLALRKLLVQAVGYGLGLATRDDPNSVMQPGADEASLLTTPGADDVLLLRHLWANVGLRIGQASLEAKQRDEAERALTLIPVGMPQAVKLTDALKQ